MDRLAAASFCSGGACSRKLNLVYIAIQDCGDIRGGLEDRARQSKLLQIASGG
jgi:hypothetical protein